VVKENPDRSMTANVAFGSVVVGHGSLFWSCRVKGRAISTSGSRRLARLKVLVKRLVCIEDLGDIDILVTDKTGTLTEGQITLIDAVDPAGYHAESVLRSGLLATDVDPATGGVSANELDAALWDDR
jgi:high-affinity K+ transport system ATPase subunit B